LHTSENLVPKAGFMEQAADHKTTKYLLNYTILLSINELYIRLHSPAKLHKRYVSVWFVSNRVEHSKTCDVLILYFDSWSVTYERSFLLLNSGAVF